MVRLLDMHHSSSLGGLSATAPQATLLQADEHAAEPPPETEGFSSATVTVIREPLFAVMSSPCPTGDDAAGQALALLGDAGPEPGAAPAAGCMALLSGRSVTAAASTGAVFRSRGRRVERIVVGGSTAAVRTASALPGDLYALCSPGLLANIPVARVRSVLRSPGPPQQIAKRLLAFAHQSRDAADAAVVVFRVSGPA